MTHSVLTFVNFACMQLKHSLFSSHNEVNVRLTYGNITLRVLYICYQRNSVCMVACCELHHHHHYHHRWDR